MKKIIKERKLQSLEIKFQMDVHDKYLKIVEPFSHDALYDIYKEIFYEEEHEICKTIYHMTELEELILTSYKIDYKLLFI